MKATDIAFEALVHEHSRRCFAYALGLAPNHQVAEDLLQDSLIIAHRKMTTFDPSRNFGSWVRGIIRFAYLQWCRKQRETPMAPEEIAEIDHYHRELDSAEDEPGEAIKALDQCMDELPSEMAAAVELFYMNDKKGEDVAYELGINLPTVRKRLQRAREKLAQCIRLRLTEEGLA